eukprot:6982400-Prymnesium_polylepis.1
MGLFLAGSLYAISWLTVVLVAVVAIALDSPAAFMGGTTIAWYGFVAGFGVFLLCTFYWHAFFWTCQFGTPPHLPDVLSAVQKDGYSMLGLITLGLLATVLLWPPALPILVMAWWEGWADFRFPLSTFMPPGIPSDPEVVALSVAAVCLSVSQSIFIAALAVSQTYHMAHRCVAETAGRLRATSWAPSLKRAWSSVMRLARSGTFRG